MLGLVPLICPPVCTVTLCMLLRGWSLIHSVAEACLEDVQLHAGSSSTHLSSCVYSHSLHAAPRLVLGTFCG